MEIHRVLQRQGKTESEIDKAIQDISGSVIEIIIPGESDLLSAYNLIRKLRIDPADAIHLAIAEEKGAIFVTRDIELTNKIKDTIKTITPRHIN